MSLAGGVALPSPRAGGERDGTAGREGSCPLSRSSATLPLPERLLTGGRLCPGGPGLRALLSSRLRASAVKSRKEIGEEKKNNRKKIRPEEEASGCGLASLTAS